LDYGKLGILGKYLKEQKIMEISIGSLNLDGHTSISLRNQKPSAIHRALKE